MQISAREIAELLHGEVDGDPEVKVSAPARIENAKAGTVCFLANMKYEHYLYGNKASVVLVNKDFQPSKPVGATLVRVDDAYSAIASLLGFMTSKKRSGRGNRLAAFFTPSIHLPLSAKVGRRTRIEKCVVIGRKAVIGDDCHIFPQAYIGENVRIGSGVMVGPGVKIYRDCIIGDRCILHANAVIGADGFGFAPSADGTYSKIPQTGNVVLGDDVEIGACTTVDRATMESTVIRSGVKIDNLCQVGHNVEVGENTVMAAMSGIAGSAKVGASCMIGGQSGIIGHVSIADHTTVAGRSGVMSSVKKEGETLLGFPAFDHKEFLRAYAIFKANGKKK